MRRRNFFRSLLGVPAVAVAPLAAKSPELNIRRPARFGPDGHDHWADSGGPLAGDRVQVKLYDRNWQCSQCGLPLLNQRLEDDRLVMVCYGVLADGKPCPQSGRVFLVPQLETTAQEINPAQRVKHERNGARYDLRTGKAIE